MPEATAVIDVRGLHKRFEVPVQQVSTLKERAVHPFRRDERRTFEVLRGIDFQVAKGEFLGIVGRNGSGKSTALKCLAGIYRADAGRISVSGRLVPFLELGVGFNPDLTARENVLVNAVMMGLSPREARRRFDAVLEFAELHEFVDLKLKNYSSGMQVRLAFAIMIQSDAEIFLVDEVLAVGDAAFQQKCFDSFADLKERGRTVVLVTHDMGSVERICHRALLIKDGLVEAQGDPGEVGRRYLELNFEHDSGRTGSQEGRRASIRAAWVEHADGTRADAVDRDSEFHVCVDVEAHEHVTVPEVGAWLSDDAGTRVAGGRAVGPLVGIDELDPGDRVVMRLRPEGRLVPGRYRVGAHFCAGQGAIDLLAHRERLVEVTVYGGEHTPWLVGGEGETTLARLPADPARARSTAEDAPAPAAVEAHDTHEPAGEITGARPAADARAEVRP